MDPCRMGNQRCKGTESLLAYDGLRRRNGRRPGAGEDLVYRLELGWGPAVLAKVIDGRQRETSILRKKEGRFILVPGSGLLSSLLSFHCALKRAVEQNDEATWHKCTFCCNFHRSMHLTLFFSLLFFFFHFNQMVFALSPLLGLAYVLATAFESDDAEYRKRHKKSDFNMEGHSE